MAYPRTLAPVISGRPGYISHDGPTRAAPFRLNSGVEANNVFGRAFTHSADGVVAAGGAGAFAGILSSPNAYAIDQATLPNGQMGEFLQMGEIYVELVSGRAAAAVNPATVPAVGLAVYYIAASGELTCDANDGLAVPVLNHTAIPSAIVVRHLPNQGLAVIAITGPSPTS